MSKGIEYKGTTFPVDKLDKVDKQLARHIARHQDDATMPLRNEIFQNPEAYQAYKHIYLSQRPQEKLRTKAKKIVTKVYDIFKPSPRR